MGILTIGSHLIAKQDSHNIVECLDSCEGLVDFTVVAVDSRPESDETFNLIKDRKNTFCYRQKWEDSFATARNNSLKTLLDLRPDVNFILWVDSDDQWQQTGNNCAPHEEIRKRLEDLKPEAVNNIYIYAKTIYSKTPNNKLNIDHDSIMINCFCCRSKFLFKSMILNQP